MRRLKRMGRKFVSVALALTMTLGLIATGNFATITQAVSYTHLDVYKRQVDNVFECIDNKTFKQTYNVKSFSIVPIDYEF